MTFTCCISLYDSKAHENQIYGAIKKMQLRELNSSLAKLKGGLAIYSTEMHNFPPTLKV